MKPECESHALWDKNFKVACWGFLILGFITGIIYSNILLGIFFFFLSGVILVFASWKDVQHARWHLENDEDDYDFKP